MHSILNTCIVVVICGICLVSSAKGVEDIVNSLQKGMEVKAPKAKGDSRASPSITVDECRTLGRTCAIIRNDRKPSEVTLIPCCKHMTCQGLGPYEILKIGGSAHHSDYNAYTGICTLSLDNDSTKDEKDNYDKDQ